MRAVASPRRVAVTALLLLTAILLVACGGAPQPDPGAGDRVGVWDRSSWDQTVWGP